jgi:HAD superfamily hydrolase (TIGR01549 family)
MHAVPRCVAGHGASIVRMDAVLFDWDGTLIDTLETFYRANAVVMAHYGVPFDEAQYRAHVAADWRRMYLALGLTGEQLDEANARWHLELDGAQGAMLLPGVGPALDRLAAARIVTGLVTAGNRSLVTGQLQRLGLGRRFAVVVCGDDLEVQKPDPGPLRHALRALGLGDRPAGTAYVGDTPDDMRMARAVGVRAVGVPSLIGDPHGLLAAGAHEVADSVATWVDGLVGQAGSPAPGIVPAAPGATGAEPPAGP